MEKHLLKTIDDITKEEILAKAKELTLEGLKSDMHPYRFVALYTAALGLIKNHFGIEIRERKDLEEESEELH